MLSDLWGSIWGAISLLGIMPADECVWARSKFPGCVSKLFEWARAESIRLRSKPMGARTRGNRLSFPPCTIVAACSTDWSQSRISGSESSKSVSRLKRVMISWAAEERISESSFSPVEDSSNLPPAAIRASSGVKPSNEVDSPDLVADWIVSGRKF